MNMLEKIIFSFLGTALGILAVILILWMPFYSIRYEFVYNARDHLRDKIEIMDRRDIDEDEGYDRWRTDALKLYSQHKMFWQLFKWRWTLEDIFDNYYKEMSLTKPYDYYFKNFKMETVKVNH
ncbi:MAG: hypothetical protein WC208_14125 [Gallionella sp.]|jgi:hypothetical protein